MIGYLISSWQLKRRFEPIEGGYHFRRHSWSEAYQFSAEERDVALHNFRQQYWRRNLKYWGVFFAFLIAWSAVWVLLHLFVDGSSVKVISELLSWAFVVVITIGIVRLQYGLQSIPLDYVAERHPIAPRRNLTASFAANCRKRSWGNIIIWAVAVLGLGAISFPLMSISGWYLAIWLVYFGAAALSFVAQLYLKVRAGS